MANYQGFTLTEVLVSLLLVTSTSLAILRQQWQLSQVLNQTLSASRALVQLDNNSEKINASQPPRSINASQTPGSSIEKPFRFSKKS
jgi:prepilin-type N-terminal cleavage/methylation domain-containing protein